MAQKNTTLSIVITLASVIFLLSSGSDLASGAGNRTPLSVRQNDDIH